MREVIRERDTDKGRRRNEGLCCHHLQDDDRQQGPLNRW